MTIRTTKTCSRCKLILGLHHFTENRSRPDGLSGCCGECRKYYAGLSRERKQAQAEEAAKIFLEMDNTFGQ